MRAPIHDSTADNASGFLGDTEQRQVALTDKLPDGGKKKLLALDGGGIRGLITLGFLAEIESLLRVRTGAGEDFVLADYFDYVAGTSTGAVIATAISMGMSVSEITDFYQNSGEAMFDKASLLTRLTRSRYEDEALAETLRQIVVDRLGNANATLGDPGLRTLLMMVMRNVTTDSPWPVSNNPQAKYNDPELDDSNLMLPLWQLVRASTAAPVYFPPETVTLGKRTFVFVDGAVTMYNNPAFQLFLMATLEPYRLGWTASEERMLLVSLGSGVAAEAEPDLEAKDLNHVKNIVAIPSALMYGALNEQDLLCRSFGRCRHGAVLDGEVGDMVNAPSVVPGRSEKLFTYMRYNADISREGLDAVGLNQVEPANVSKIDSTEFIGDLSLVGEVNAKEQVRAEHFDGFFAE